MRPSLLFAWVAVVAAQQDPIEDFCRRHQHQTCVIDDKLYIDGGKVFYGGSIENGSIAQQNTRLLWENVLATDNETEFPTQYKNLTKHSEVPSVSGGVLWPDITNKLFYLFGGEYNDVASVQPFTKLWYFDVVYNTWNQTSPSPTQSGISWPAFGSGIVTEGGTAYYYGGYLSNKTTPKWNSDPLMLSSLISFDMDTQTWSNQTYDSTSRAGGSLQYLPASASGILVYFGGIEGDSEGGVRYANMSEIRVFDINENKWFTQIASGDVPSPRRGVCAGVAWANDHSSYNIYVQGGVRDDVNTVRRSSQMIIIGGYYANASFTQCDVPKYYGQHGLLLGQESAEVAPPEVKWFWRLWSGYNKYRVPDKIVSLIGGNTDGHATRTMPLQGWTTPSPLGPYFQHLNWEGPRTASRALPGTPTASNQPTQNSQSGPNVGAIAGGTVGGVVALVALISTIFFCLHCRHSREAPNQSQTELDSNTKSELDGFHKSNPSHTGSEGGTEMSSTGSATSCSPQFSLPHGTNSWNRNQAYYQVSPPQRGEEWTQQGAYYPPPPDLSQAYKHPHEISAELPEARSPVNAELSDLSSPAYADLPDSRGV
ncbi:hypothetical protein ST47_g7169 [Ascochyta rabiei]|uniref:Uncharacterized protein n=1 Tax=Didymella rabiei TaxID=5454 RepID=A0A163BHN1_DIDRA|nr:hypothetical protein ST47_g7169 [Ascochyta rabiei]